MPTLRLANRTVSTATSAFVHPLPATARSWNDIAELAWLECQVAAFEMRDYERHIVQLEHRLIAARVWFSSREPSHPHWTTALARRAVLDREQRNREATLRCIALRCWTGCRDLWVSLTMGMPPLEAADWTHENALSWPLQGPQDIWLIVAGERSVPGSWPTEERDYWVESRPKQVPTWDLPGMRELRELQLRGA